jgi:16S rRNA (guanine527-N7)-methyltransferase
VASDAENERHVVPGIAALVGRYRLPPGAAAKLESLLELLVADPLAPTAIRDAGAAINDHLADSLVALELEPLHRCRAVVDIGSGAGLPGLPLAIARPRAAFMLLESARRKCSFLERAIETVGLTNVEVVNDRAELWYEGLGRYDLATARALAPLEVVVEYAAPLLRRGGVLAVWRGQRDPDAERAAQRAAVALGMGAWEVLPVVPYAGAKHRHIYLTSKVRETPPGFPRRPGTALKRPLGSLGAASDRRRR